MSAITVSKRPTRLSSAVGVAAASIAIALAIGVEAATVPLAIELAGLAVTGLGVAAVDRGHRAAGLAIGSLGVVASLGSLPVAAATIDEVSVVLSLVPGLLGVFALTLAVLPVRGNGSRWLVKLGTALVFLGVLAAALFGLSPPPRLLLCAVLTVVAWDAGENAIGVGEQLGSLAETRRLELVHVGGSAAIGIVGIAAVVAVGGVSVGSFSLESFVLLLGALVLLTLSLHG